MKKIFFRVDKGDSLLSVSNTFNVPPIEIINYNGLKRELEGGDIIVVPLKEGVFYTVGVGEDEKSVAKKFNVDEKKLLQINGVPYLFYRLTIRIE